MEEPLLDGLIELSRALVAAREAERAAFEAAIAPVWSELAERFELAWSPERSTLTGARRGVKLELRVDGEPGLLYTELYLEWPTLRRGLAIDRRGARGAAGPTVSENQSAPVERAFTSSHRARAGATSAALSVDVMRGALEIGATGASLTIDDTGLVARLDEVVDDRAVLDRWLRGALAIGVGLQSGSRPRGAYR